MASLILSQVPVKSPNSAVALEKAVAEAMGRVLAKCELWGLQGAAQESTHYGIPVPSALSALSEGLSLFRAPGGGQWKLASLLVPPQPPTYSVELEDI